MNHAGRVGIVASIGWAEPLDRYDPEDLLAVEIEQEFTGGWIVNPVVNGDYPEIMKQMIADKSRLQGYNQSRLPEFTEAEKERMKGKEVSIQGYKGYGMRVC